jgi:putative redox protein
MALQTFYNRQMREVTVGWAGGTFAQDVEVAGHHLRADEEIEKGGDNTGAAPHELLLAALGSCTAMTLKAYAERKGWPLTDVHVKLNGATGQSGLAITREVRFEGTLTAEQRQRLLEIADRCPVHRSLVGDITISTTAVGA